MNLGQKHGKINKILMIEPFMPLILPVTLAALALVFGFSFIRLIQRLKSISHKLNQLSDKQLSVHEDIRYQLNQQEQNTLNAIQLSKQSLHEILLKQQQNQQKESQSMLFSQMQDIRLQTQQSFKQHADSLSSHLKTLSQQVKSHLDGISKEVNVRLNEGFDKTNETFTNIVKRLTIIDEAQKKITELSHTVVSLQDLLSDKKSRGAFGEVQLNVLIKNTIPGNHYRFQHTLSNGKRVDCMLLLPPPTGNITIDAKFPLECYQAMHLAKTPEEKKQSASTFKQTIKKHISDIKEKYIIHNETADSAIMFIPAEAIFSEIHAHHPEIIDYSHQSRVWLTSPNTLMAILTTAKAVLKDDATKKQVNIIKQHLHALSLDFSRFDKRMNNLSRHISQAHQDVDNIHTSAKKISARFNKIDSLELSENENDGINVPKLESNEN